MSQFKRSGAVEWYSVRAHGKGLVQEAALAFGEVYPTDVEKIDLIRQRYALRRSLHRQQQQQQQPNKLLSETVIVEFRTFGPIDPAFIQYADSLRDLEAVAHDDMWMFSAVLVEAEHDAHQQEEDVLSPRRVIQKHARETEMASGAFMRAHREKRARRSSFVLASTAGGGGGGDDDEWHS